MIVFLINNLDFKHTYTNKHNQKNFFMRGWCVVIVPLCRGRYRYRKRLVGVSGPTSSPFYVRPPSTQHRDPEYSLI